MSKANRDRNRSERAAAIQAAQARAERNRRLGLVGAVIVVLAILAGAVFWSVSGDGDKAKDRVVTAEVKAGDHSLLVGPDDAKNKVVVYEDFLCPYCREFEMASRDYLHADAEKGTVQIEYRPFHLLPDDYSLRALNAFATVLEESPATALKLHDLLYEEQPYEQAADKPDADKLADWAEEVGASKSAVKAAVQTGDKAWAQAAGEAAEKADVQGTPTVIVNGQPLQGASISDMSDNLEKMLAGDSGK